MPAVMVLSKNIYDEDGKKRLRGEQFDASQEFCDMVLTGDADAEREPRIGVIQVPKSSKANADR